MPVHMCHAGGHRQCVISESFTAMSPHHRIETAPKTKIVLPGVEAKTAKARSQTEEQSKTLLGL